jgi:tRNA nucleotidyltransferase (CCA-adding enzyme)
MDTSNLPCFRLPPGVAEVIQKIQAEGFSAYIVGGALRNIILEQEIRDWDIATGAPCEKIMSVFSRVFPTGILHGTVTVVMGALPVEVTSFGDKGILGDLDRRDFTINAMAYDPSEKRLIDPHKGVRDLRAKRLQAVGDPYTRFAEDPLRVVRAIRIAAELGFRMSRQIWDTIPHFLELLPRVAPERMREELNRIMETPRAAQAFRWMKRTGALQWLFPELLQGTGEKTGGIHSGWEHSLRMLENLPPRQRLRWAGFLHDTQKTQEILSRYRFNRKEIQEITRLIEHRHICHVSHVSEGMIRRLLMQFGAEWIEDLNALCRADTFTTGMKSPKYDELEAFALRTQRILTEHRSGVNFTPVLNGEAVMAILGIPPGPEVGKILGALQHMVTEDPSVNTREGLYRWLIQQYGKSGKKIADSGKQIRED